MSIFKKTSQIKFRQSEQKKIEIISQQTGISSVVAKVLVNRGIDTADEVKRFLNTDVTQLHNPFLMKDMQKACDRIIEAIEKKQNICVYGDYDVDGAVSTSLLILFFKELGVDIDFYIPNRLTEGYSINKDSLHTLKENLTDLIITVDNGVSAYDAIQYANALGMDVVVTDHHQVPELLPEAVAVVDPSRPDCEYPFKGVCGACVAYKLMMALRQALREKDYFKDKEEPNLKKYLDLVCLATICDVVPLKNENRYFVKEGLKYLLHSERAGIKALKKICVLEDKTSFTTYDVGFKLGPRINACGRLKNADMGVRLLTTNDDIEANKNAKMLDYLNKERQGVELKIVNDVLERIEKEIDLERTLGLVLYDPSWHVGVVGIVASRVVERYRRPVFILCKNEDGEIKGSGRSIPTVNLVACLADCAESLVKYGGHEAAAGVTMTEFQLETFVESFDKAVKKQMSLDDTQETVVVDDDLTNKSIDWDLVNELKQLEPHGVGNARPLFVSEDIHIKSKRIVGKGHLKLNVKTKSGEYDAIAFNKGEVIDDLHEKAKVVFGLEVNTFRDKQSIQLVVKDFVE